MHAGLFRWLAEEVCSRAKFGRRARVCAALAWAGACFSARADSTNAHEGVGRRVRAPASACNAS
eukprot:5972265-Pleurochrysis_carterae.AAC.1